MALVLTKDFHHQANKVFCPNTSEDVIRVASKSSGTIGTISSNMNVTWTPRGNPTWVSVSSSATVATINYDLSSVSATSGEYNFAIQATANDGTTTYIPITLAIRLPLSLK